MIGKAISIVFFWRNHEIIPGMGSDYATGAYPNLFLFPWQPCELIKLLRRSVIYRWHILEKIIKTKNAAQFDM